MLLSKRVALVLICAIIWTAFIRPIGARGQTEKTRAQALECSMFPQIELSVMPIKFNDERSKNPKGDVLKGLYAGSLETRQMMFLIPFTLECPFFKLDGDWEVEINKKDFCRESKKKVWLVYFDAHNENIIYTAHQMKEADFGTIDYWDQLRCRVMYIHNVQKDYVGLGDNAKPVYKAYWIAMKILAVPVQDIMLALRVLDLLKIYPSSLLEDGSRWPLLIKFADNYAMIADHGVFIVNDTTLFSTIQEKLGGGLLSIIGPKRLMIKQAQKDIDFFLKNHKKELTFVFYTPDKNAVAISMYSDQTQAIDPKAQTKPKK